MVLHTHVDKEKQKETLDKLKFLLFFKTKGKREEKRGEKIKNRFTQQKIKRGRK